MNKVIDSLIWIVAVAVLLASGTYIYQVYVPQLDELGGVLATPVVNLIGTATAPYSFATAPTSTAVVTLGAEIDQLDLFASYNASSTAALYWQQAYSYDAGCSSATDTTIRWFGEDIITSTSTDPDGTASNSYLLHSATTTIHAWVPSDSGLNYRSIPVVNLNANCVRLTFFTSSTTDSSELNLQVVGKQVSGGR